MSADISVGPVRKPGHPSTGEVDAHKASEADQRRGMAGAETKPEPKPSGCDGSAGNPPEPGSR